MLLNKAELSEVLGISERTLTDWQGEEPPMPIKERALKRGQPNGYDATEVIAWYVQRQTREGRVETPRDRLARLQSDEVEMRLNERRSLLVSADQVEPMWRDMVDAARAHMRGQLDGLAQLLESVEGVEAKRDRLAEAFDEILNKLSAYDPANNTASDSTIPTTATP